MRRKLFSLILAAVLVLGTAGCEFTVNENYINKKYDVAREGTSGKLYFPKTFEGGSAVEYLLSLEENRDYHIVVENFGGSAFDSLAIINRLQELQRKGFHITTESYGYAMSAGAFIFAIGDTRIAHTGAAFMIHGAGIGKPFGSRLSLRMYEHTKEFEGTPHQMDSLMIIDNTYKDLLRNIGWSEKEIKDWMYTEDFNWMTSEEALEMNLATELN